MFYVRFYDGIATTALCKEVIEYFDNNTEFHLKFDESTKYYDNLAKKQLTQLVLHEDGPSPELFAQLNGRLFSTIIEKYRTDCQVNLPLIECKEIRLKKYTVGEGDFIGWHSDGATYNLRDRVLQCLLYLNTVEEGGETVFRVSGQDCAIQPIEGRLALFPPTFQYKHKADSPISNSKYVAVASFVYTPPK